MDAETIRREYLAPSGMAKQCAPMGGGWGMRYSATWLLEPGGRVAAGGNHLAQRNRFHAIRQSVTEVARTHDDEPIELQVAQGGAP